MIPTPPASRSAPTPAILPYGEWPSPLDIERVVQGGNRLGALLVAAGALWWTEGRAAEQGRHALCRQALNAAPGTVETVLPAPSNVRNRVHEYGGGTLASDGTRLWFCEDGDAGIHVIDIGPDRAADPAAARLLHREPGCRYADLTWWAQGRCLLAIREDHRRAGQEASNALVAITVEGPAAGQVRTLAEGHDFFSSPAPSPDGRWLAWLSWDHPDMPWDATTLWCAPCEEGKPGTALQLAGGPGESVFQPCWSPSGELHFVSDRSGWWNLYRITAAELHAVRAEPPRADRIPVARALCPMAAEFAAPQWEFGMRSYGFCAAGELIAVVRSEGEARLARVPAQGGELQVFDLPWRDFRALQLHGRQAFCVAGAPDRSETLIRIDLASGRWVDLLADPDPGQDSRRIDPALVSRPRSVQFPGSGGVMTHAFLYLPHHPAAQAPEGTLPPLIVINHGGPTSATSSTLRLAIQFWTTRGFAVLDVNYGGSSGFGRAYRERLFGQWGVVDVEDAVAGVRWLAAQGLIDGARAAIRGSSAGGFTTLAALAFHRVFRAGVSLYGIGDLSLLASDTHKFESRYLDRLVAPWPEGRALYEARSPLAHVGAIEAALLLLQGEEDKVVPPNQAQRMYDAARAKGLPVACLMFAGEQHGFRRGDTVRRALAAELYFYGRVFGFTPADPLEPIEIANLG